MVKLPSVTVSPTLAELYPTLDKQVALVPIIVLSTQQLSDNVPQSTKFLYQDTSINGHENSKENQDEKPPASVKYLSLIPQRFAFAAGSMPVVMFDIGS